jgi:hypothetical protein
MCDSCAQGVRLSRFRCIMKSTEELFGASSALLRYLSRNSTSSAAFRLLKENEDEIRAAWEDHFGRRG